jgi:RNA polymerase sigma-70 factor (ECF subfamily)
MSVWSYQGLPDNPGAWLATVARNKAFDQLRRQKREVDVPAEEASEESEDSNLFAAQIEDPELRLILLCCHTNLSELERLTLTLKLACGFTAREIAEVFLARENSIGQRIARAKQRLRTVGTDLDQLPLRFGIESRLPSALQVLYLMFSLGYAPLSGNRPVRFEVAMEALRLAEELATNEICSQIRTGVSGIGI